MPRTKQFDEHEVLDKAMELFWEKGFHDTSIQDLVTFLGINRASMYHTYGGKETLFLRALTSYREKVFSHFQEILFAGGTTLDSFYQLFHDIADRLGKDSRRRGCFLVNTLTELLPGDAHVLTYMDQVKERETEMYERRIQEGIESGDIKEGTHTSDLAHYFYNIHCGLTVTSKIALPVEELHKMVDHSLSVLRLAEVDNS